MNKHSLDDMLAAVDPCNLNDLDDGLDLNEFAEGELTDESYMVSDLNPHSRPVPADGEEREEIIWKAWREADNPTKWYYILKAAMPEEAGT